MSALPIHSSLRVLSPTRPRIMGILNVTPDSFSDGGLYRQLDAAIAQAESLVTAGAQLVDVGGESTRPGAEHVSVREEKARVLPVIAALVERGIPVSVDTMNASTALAAAELGAQIINDVSAGQADAGMARVVAETGLTFIAGHWRRRFDPKTATASAAAAVVAGSDAGAAHIHILREVAADLIEQIAELLVIGVQPDQIVLDPGLGFGKSPVQNWRLLAKIQDLGTLGFPVMIGASRKRFLAELVGVDEPASSRDPATATISALAAQAGAWGVRVHNVAQTKAALDVWEAMQP